MRHPAICMLSCLGPPCCRKRGHDAIQVSCLTEKLRLYLWFPEALCLGVGGGGGACCPGGGVPQLPLNCFAFLYHVLFLCLYSQSMLCLQYIVWLGILHGVRKILQSIPNNGLIFCDM